MSDREDFEEAAARMGYSLRMRDPASEDGEYGDRETQCAWDMWQECCDKAARQAPASGEVEPVADELRTPEQNRRVNKLMGKLWDVYTDDDPDAQLKVHRVWDLLVQFEAEVSATHPPAKVPDGLTEKALELCRAVENEEEFPPAKFALRCLMLVNQIRKLASNPTPATIPQQPVEQEGE